jgi:hypothetical protein
MTSILSTISGYFSKHLILGSFLPVVIFLILGWLLLVPIFPPDWSFFKPLEGLDKEWKFVAVSFTAIVLSGLIYNLDDQILRLYEGYPWRDSWIGRRRTRRFKNLFEATETQIRGLRTLLRAIDAARNNPQLMSDVINRLKLTVTSPRLLESKDKRWMQLWLTGDLYQADLTTERWTVIQDLILNEYTHVMEKFRREFPTRQWLILPTRLGNVIRSFEYYPTREYGIDGVEMWPRLIAQIEKEYAVIVDDAKISFDFMLNCSVLSGILSAAFLLIGLIHPASISSRYALVSLLANILIFAFFSYVLYLLSIARADEWGKVVKSAFDLYRWKLLEQLGYKQALTSRKAERDLWAEISRQTIYGDSLAKRPLLDYSDQAPPSIPYVRNDKQEVALEMVRGIQLLEQNTAVKVFLDVKNTDPDRAATNVVITDQLPEGLNYEWGSAEVAGHSVTVTGANPYQFKVEGTLPANESVTLTYRALSLGGRQTHNVGLRFGSA